MELNDIIGGKYYAAHYTSESHPTIIKALNDGSFRSSTGLYTNINELQYHFIKSNSFECENHIRLATDEEKHHLEVCIDADKYVEYEEAMKSYIKPIEPTIQDDPELSNILIKLLTQ